MEAEALNTYFTQQRQLAGLILSCGILAVVLGGLGAMLGQHSFVRGLGLGLVIIAPLFLYYGLSLPGRFESQYATWSRLLAEFPPAQMQVSQDLQSLIAGIERLAWAYGALAIVGIIVATQWPELRIGGMGAGVAFMLLCTLIIEQLAKRHALELLTTLGGTNS